MITPSMAPGFLLEESNVRFTFDQVSIKDYAYSVGNISPSISEYIAYDTLTPPNPFIAVTQDGRGKVVYDGGFPKFYDSIGGVGSSFSTSGANVKYLINAVNWVSNPTKPKKMLVLGDCISAADSYSVKKAGGTGFRNCMTGVAGLTGYTLTIKNANDWAGNMIDIRLEELEQYALVIFMGVAGNGSNRITTQSVNDMVTYRENGNGIIMITDHGVAITDISQAANGTATGFFINVNRVAARFGAYFTGDYNRTPVNVGFLRTTYGDHPLYANLSNAENIPAGGSESRVVVPPNPTLYPPSTPLNVFLTRGTQNVNIFLRMKDGSIQQHKFTYIVQGDEIVRIRSTNFSNVVEENTKFYRNVNGTHRLSSIAIDSSQFGTISGVIKLNENIIGGVYSTAASTRYDFYLKNLAVFGNGDDFTVEIRTPISYKKTLKVSGKSINEPRNSAFYQIEAMNEATASSSLAQSLSKVLLPGAVADSIISVANQVATITKSLNGFPQTPGPNNTTIQVYDTEAAILAIPVTVSTIDLMVINRANHSAYASIAGKMTKLTTPLNVLFPTPCKVGANAQYTIDTNGRIS